jgi:hypothetical protein
MRKRAIVIALAAALLSTAAAAALAVAAREVTVLVLDVPDHRATLLVKRTPTLGMGLIESETTICSRQGPGMPLHSVILPAPFCPLALAGSPFVTGKNVLLSLPFLKVLHAAAG